MSEYYPSDLTDGQWQLIRALLPKRSKVGRPPIDRREILNAILYVVRTGCQWRQLPLDFPKWKTVTFGWLLQTVLPPAKAQGFVVLPKRWIVERTFSWITRHRRHARDYERNTDTSEAMIHIAMISLMARRLTR